jgi:hypothetical protein
VLVQGEDPYTVRITNPDRIAYEKTAPGTRNGRSTAAVSR